MLKLHLGDVVRMKKKHPCGEDRWEVLRTGADIRVRCLGCGRMLLLPRRKLEKSITEVAPVTAEGSDRFS